MDKQLRHFNRERLKEEAALGIYAIMEKGMSRADLARAIGKSRSFVTKVLEGSHNFTLETMADIYGVLGRAVHLTLGSDVREFRLPVDEVTVKPASSETSDLQIIAIDLRTVYDEHVIRDLSLGAGVEGGTVPAIAVELQTA